MKIIAVGDNVVDCYLDKKVYFPGGNCVNVAVNAKRAGAEVIEYIGVFGNDDKALHIQDVLSKEEIEFKDARYAIGKTGQPQVAISEDGDRVFVGGPKDTVQHRFKINLLPTELEKMKEYDVCHISVYSSMESELKKVAAVTSVSYDFSNRVDLEYIRSIAGSLRFAFFSASDLSSLEIKELVQELEPFDIEVVGITRGDQPAMFVHKGQFYYQVLRPIKVVDTMGAGDSLIAGFLVSYLNGNSIEQAIQDGTISAEKTCQIEGGFGYPKELS